MPRTALDRGIYLGSGNDEGAEANCAGGACVNQKTCTEMTAKELLDRYAAGERYFGWAYLREAYLTGSDLRWANLTGAYLRGADLHRANLGGAKFGDKEILSSGSIGLAASSGRHATWLVFTDGSTHCFTGCFSDSIDELDRQSAQKHNGADREWYESAIAHIRLSARIALEKAALHSQSNGG